MCLRLTVLHSQRKVILALELPRSQVSICMHSVPTYEMVLYTDATDVNTLLNPTEYDHINQCSTSPRA